MGLSLRLINTWWLLVSFWIKNAAGGDAAPSETRSWNIYLEVMSVSLLKWARGGKSVAKYERCKNPTLMRLRLKWNNHPHSKQKRSSIMQMTEAVTLFNGWSGFCDIQETVAQKGEISNWCSFIVAEHFSHFSLPLQSILTLFSFKMSPCFIPGVYKSTGDIYGWKTEDYNSRLRGHWAHKSRASPQRIN